MCLASGDTAAGAPVDAVLGADARSGVDGSDVADAQSDMNDSDDDDDENDVDEDDDEDDEEDSDDAIDTAVGTGAGIGADDSGHKEVNGDSRSDADNPPPWI